ncbi:hypothetical protein E3U55_07260 [Filobacillus milosensis]|uniref:HTH-type transcriptional regulator n=2 Tax=Filobacillus milosensis TaxID=94137 RepID=A0A4Y8ILH8_9BACI|nr:hypothetical protein E3U55_07260 [Filobacillus milosensis]
MTNHEQERLENINNLMISEFSKTLEMFALNKTEAQLFVTLFLNDEPMTLDDMKEVLGKSKTAMSTSIRTLLDYNLVEKVFIKGARKDLYQAKKDLYEKFMKTYVNRWLEALDRQVHSLESIEKELKKLDTNGENISHKIHEAIKFHQSLEEVFQQISKYDQ